MDDLNSRGIILSFTEDIAVGRKISKRKHQRPITFTLLIMCKNSLSEVSVVAFTLSTTTAPDTVSNNKLENA